MKKNNEDFSPIENSDINLEIKNKTNRIEGFDYLRAIACIFVVAFHVNPFPRGSNLEKVSLLILGSAVPIFILISLFLTELKISNKNYIFIKSYRLLKIYFFWGIVVPLIIFFTLDSQRGNYQFNLNEIIAYWFNFNFVFKYLSFLPFITILFFLVWIFYIFIKPINNYHQLTFIFIVFCIFNFTIPLLPDNLSYFRSVSVNPLGIVTFFVYLPAAKILVFDYQNSQQNLRKKIYFFAVAYLFIASIETTLQLVDGRYFGLPQFHYSLYGRLSVVLLAITLMYASFLIKKPLESFSLLLTIINKCSLGIFLIHGYLILFGFLSEIQFVRFLITFALSTLISLIIYDLPILKKTIRL